jgi:hypothetical protein
MFGDGAIDANWRPPAKFSTWTKLLQLMSANVAAERHVPLMLAPTVLALGMLPVHGCSRR